MTVRSRRYVLFLTAVGLVGWAALIAASYVPALAPEGAPSAGAVPFLLFFVFALGTRLFSFHILPETRISLDEAFYIAAAACLGSVAAGKMVALVLTLDALLRHLRAEGERDREQSLGFVVYYGGMSGGLLLALGWLFGVDRVALAGRMGEDGRVAATVFGFGLAFLVLHYLLTGVRFVLQGTCDARSYLRRMAVPGILAEASLLPLAVVVVLLFDAQRPLGFVLLGATFLLANFLFGRLTAARQRLRLRVAELETLNRTAHAIGSTLRLDEVIQTIARETMAAIPEAELLALARLEGAELVVDCFERSRGELTRIRTSGDGSLSAWVLENRRALYLGDVLRSPLAPKGHPGIRSWLGVPIEIHDEVVGVLSVQSHERDAFSHDRRRLLEALGAQAAVAIQNARLYALATVDGLTGLYVRRYFDARLREELERARRFQGSFGLILLDVDDFKALNDTHGHPLGDKVLRELAQTVRRHLRAVDIPARYGGEELAVILPRASLLETHAVAERIREEIAQMAVPHDGGALRVTASLGVACWPESGEGDAADIVHRADVALYRAKQAGKNRVEIYWAADAEPSIVKMRRKPT